MCLCYKVSGRTSCELFPLFSLAAAVEQQKWQWKHTRLTVILCDQGGVVPTNDDYEIEEEVKGNLAFARAGRSPNRDNIG